LTALAALVAFTWSFPMGADWSIYFRPAALQMIRFQTPYSIEGFYNPPWTLLPLIPFALLPERLGGMVISFFTLLGYGYAAYRMGARPLTLAILLTSPPALMAVYNANVEWLAVLGFILPPYLGLFFVMMKPQIGAGVALFWLIQAFRSGGIRQVLVVFSPVTIAFLLSFLIFGLYPMNSINLYFNK
jgi:hypothetical protein